ncbi:hypothetical protein GGP85_001910 [Salinibacter ruber]|nr:hypothetical protein [Salinibacter ruber]
MSEHPDVAVPKSDTIHYYDMFYARGEEWYEKHFDHAEKGQILYDPTTTYIRSPWAPRRIAKENPDAKIMLCLRDPIDRAFSHYWHEKKKGKISFEFEEVLENYDLYSSWIEPGFYAEHIERYLQYFDHEQFLFLRFEELKDDPKAFLTRILRFAGVNEDFETWWLQKESNEAGGRRTFFNRVWRKLKKVVAQSEIESVVRGLGLDDGARYLEERSVLGSLLKDKSEYESGIDPELHMQLRDLSEPEIQRLEKLLDIKLDAWKTIN